MSLDPLLLDLLVCPIDKQALLYLPDDEILYNPRLRRRYRVADGIPVLLADQGEPVTDEWHAGLLHRVEAAAGQAGERRDVLTTLRAPLEDLVKGQLPGAGGEQDTASA